MSPLLLTVAKAIINKGTCRNRVVMSALRDLFWCQTTHNFRLKAIHMPGSLNQIPDAISRLHEWGQIQRLYSLLCNWHCEHFDFNLYDKMSPESFQVLTPIIQRWLSTPHCQLMWPNTGRLLLLMEQNALMLLNSEATSNSAIQ